MLFKQYKIKRLLKKIKSLKHAREHNQPSDDAIKKEMTLYFNLAKLYSSLNGNKKFPFANMKTLECYRAAAELEDPEAQYIFGNRLLQEAKCRQSLQREGVLASSNNERIMKKLYEEALAYITAAEKRGHIKAKRLHGLCLINGWGGSPDKKQGFELIVESIEQENSWDKVPQMFAELGLNKPEFFSQLTQLRKGT